jgi:Tfp pilus assembly protein PilF
VGTWRDSLTLYERMLECTRDNALAHAYYGRALHGLKRDVEARAQLEISAALDPSLPFPGLGLASIALAENDLERARIELREVLRNHPNSFDANYKLGLAELRANSPQAALESFRRAVALQPSSLEALTNLATVFAMLGRNAEAEREFGELTRRHPRDPEALCAHGAFLASRGRMPEARGYFERALGLSPGHRRATELLRQASSSAPQGQPGRQ